VISGSSTIGEDPAQFDLETELLAMLDNILYGIFIPEDV
jgi:hypothetical protein